MSRKQWASVPGTKGHWFGTRLLVMTSLYRVNSLRPSDAYMCQWTKSSLVQIMAFRLFGAKPLSKPMLEYCQLEPAEPTSVTFKSKFNIFIQEMYWKMSSPKSRPFCLGLNVLTHALPVWFLISPSSLVLPRRHRLPIKYHIPIKASNEELDRLQNLESEVIYCADDRTHDVCLAVDQLFQ